MGGGFTLTHTHIHTNTQSHPHHTYKHANKHTQAHTWNKYRSFARCWKSGEACVGESAGFEVRSYRRRVLDPAIGANQADMPATVRRGGGEE